MAAAEQLRALHRDGCLLLSSAPGLELSVRLFFPVAAADLHSDVLCVAIPSVALSNMKSLLLRTHCRFLAY